mgnify:CR=1 FL=1
MRNKSIPYAKHDISSRDIAAVHETLGSDYITRGPRTKYFEEALAAYCGSQYAVVVNSGTAALHLAYRVLGVQPGDVVLSTPITFVATMNAALYCGAEPQFVDIEHNYFTLDTHKLKNYLKACETDKLPKVITGVSFSGQPYDMQGVWELAKSYDINVIADQSHAIGSSWYDLDGNVQYAGNCTYADLEVFSFQATKHITTGEGGAILTDNKKLYNQLLKLRNHGFAKKQENLDSNTSKPSWYRGMEELGYNYMMTEFQAALGLQQLHRLNDFIIQRQQHAALYNAIFKHHQDIKIPDERPNVQHTRHLYIIEVPNRNKLFNYLQKKNIGSQVHYTPIHLQPYYRKNFQLGEGDFPVSEKYYERALSLPLHTSLTHEELEYVAEEVIKCVEEEN